MMETAGMQATPVAWRYLSNAPNAKWTVQKNFPAPVEKWDGYSVEPLYSHAYVATLQAQITRLREALKPFAAVAEDLDRPFSSGRSRVYLKGSYEPQRGWVVMEQLRTARAALSEPSPSNSGDTP